METLPELRVLVVDDNYDFATALSYLLQQLGCRTAVAFGGDMAVGVASAFRPGLVFLDLDMPAMDGAEVLKRLREVLEGGPAPPMFVCLTGVTLTSNRAGFDLYVAKPMAPETLAHILQSARSRLVAPGH